MTEEQKKSIENLGKFPGYFEGHSTESIYWQREFDICSQICNLISSKTEFSTTDIQNIVDIFNRINDNIHFDGSGWLDFKMRLNFFFKAFGYKVTWNKAFERIEAFERI